MSALGLGCVKTLRQGELTPPHPSFASKGVGDGYVLIAAMSGWTPMMFMTRVRL
jgi:hypothetical protein